MAILFARAFAAVVVAVADVAVVTQGGCGY